MNRFNKTLVALAGILVATVAMQASADIKPHKMMKIAGSDKNPVYRTIVPYGTRSIHQGLHRGRVAKTTITRRGSQINVHTRFENHNKKRGWHLTNEVVFLDKSGRALGLVLHEKVAISAKGWKGYKVRERSTDIKHMNGIAYVRVTTFRQADGRFLKKVLNEAVKVYEVASDILSTTSGGVIGGVINHTINRTIKDVIGGGSGGGKHRRTDNHAQYIQH